MRDTRRTVAQQQVKETLTSPCHKALPRQGHTMHYNLPYTHNRVPGGGCVSREQHNHHSFNPREPTGVLLPSTPSNISTTAAAPIQQKGKKLRASLKVLPVPPSDLRPHAYAHAPTKLTGFVGLKFQCRRSRVCPPRPRTTEPVFVC